mmetsp:Transcript_11856/g.33426  ORF Transcript_11856/g.33426 Transcript_11856/m.33426 type:complete len:209 (-) Transcript_11856:478-1104(-)
MLRSTNFRTSCRATGSALPPGTLSTSSFRPGRATARETNALSSALSCKMLPTEASKPWSISSALPASCCGYSRSTSCVTSLCIASHLLKGSASFASRNLSSSSLCSKSRITGAENPRSKEGTGFAGMPWKTNVCSQLQKRSTAPPPAASTGLGAPPSVVKVVRGRSFPSLPRSPSRMGISWACFSPSSTGVTGSVCRHLSVKAWAPSS